MNRSLRVKDNIDVNPKANFNKSSYHGTSSSIIQFRATNQMKVKNLLQSHLQAISLKIKKKMVSLPAEYTSVKDLYLAQFKN